MKNLFDTLYDSYTPYAELPLSSAYRAKSKEYEPFRNQLSQQLSPDVLDQLWDCTSALEDIATREAFAAGIRLGSRFMLELLNGAS